MAKKHTTTVKQIPEVDLAWLAGLLEGEGSFLIQVEPHTNRDYSKELVRGSIQMKTTDEDVALRVHQIVGAGRVWGPIQWPSGTGWKPYWEWRINASVDVQALASQLYPFMGVRRGRRIFEMLCTSFGVRGKTDAAS